MRLLRLTPALLASVVLSQDAPQVAAKSAIVMEAESGRVLWSKAAEVRRYPASTTKILTALLAIESMRLDDPVYAPDDVKSVTGSSLHLVPGERISVEDALYAMMLRSANDVCHAVAMQIAGSGADFARLMNSRARELGATKSNFTNPHGLPDKRHVTTALDLARISRAAMKNSTFREVARTRERWIERSLNQQDLLLISRNRWLFKDATADGIKTGYTNDAGHCYVGSAVRNGFRVITVVLGSPNTQVDHKALLDWAFARYAVTLDKKQGTPVMSVPVEGGVQLEVSVAVDAPVRLIGVRGETYSFEWASNKPLRAPVIAGQRVGEVRIEGANGFTVEVPAVAQASVGVRDPWAHWGGIRDWIGYALAGAALGGVWVMRRRLR